MAEQDQWRMTAKEYRLAMGLDQPDVTVDKTTIKVKKEENGLDPTRGPKRIALWLLWLIAWAWMIFTFGWIGHVLANLTQKGLKK